MSRNEDFDQTQTKRSGWNNYKYLNNKNYREKPFRFNGLAAEYQRLHDLFRVNLAQKSALCIPYLLEGGHADDQDERFKISEIPPNLVLGSMIDATDANDNPIREEDTNIIRRRMVTDNDILKRNQIRHMYINNNAQIAKLDSMCMEALTPLLSEIIQTSTVRFNGDPVATWDYLKNTYGPESGYAAASRTAAVANILNSKMQYYDTFASFIIKFNKTCEQVKLSDEVKVALLAIKTNKESNYNLQILPDRLLKDIQESIKLGRSYDETIDYVSRADEFAHLQGYIKRDKAQDPRPKVNNNIKKNILTQ
jgi:hypothetical protein